MRRSYSFVRIWLAVAALTTTIGFLLTYRSIRQSEISNASIDNTQHRLSALVALEGATADLIFGSDDHAIRQASDIVFQRLDDLARLTADNPPQQTRLKRLRNELEHVAHARRGDSPHEQATRVEATVPHSLSRAMREFRTEELAVLTARLATSTATSRAQRWLLVLLAGGSVILLSWVSILVVGDERRRHKAEVALRHANEELDTRVVARTTELHDSLNRERVLRHAAETSNRLKDEFLMTVSHELRTPLNALLGWADMLRRGILSEDRQRRAADAILENAKLQARLIAELLDAARILTGKLGIETTILDLGQIVRDAAEVVAPAAQAKGLDLQVIIDSEVGPFVGDPSRLQQIVWNLVSNAVKFTQHGSVTVRLERGDSDNYLRIVVADTGQGIGQAFLPHVFDRFSQEQTGTTRLHGGLGLGLTIVRQLVELHGGTVRAESPGEGHGATFTVNLPRVNMASVVGSVRKGPDDYADDSRGMPALVGVRVLVVDDDVASREMVTAALESCGAEVSRAMSAEQAKQTLADTIFDVLLVDIAMPGEDGYALMRDIRARGLRQPAAALTAHARDVDREHACLAGFDLHIAKPVEAKALALAVAMLLGNHRATVS